MTIYEATFEQLHTACLESEDLPFQFDGYLANLAEVPNLPYEWRAPLRQQLEARKILAELFRLPLHTEGRLSSAVEAVA